MTGKAGQYELETVKDGVLTIKADVPSVGWWDGNTVDDIKSGYEYCMAAEIAQRSGLKSIDLQYMSFDGLVSGKLTGYDLSLDEISITPERQQVVDFSDPYYKSSIGVLAKKGADVTAENLADQQLGVKQGTAGQQLGHRHAAPGRSSTSSPATPRRSRPSPPGGSTPTCRTSRSSSGRPSSPAARLEVGRPVPDRRGLRRDAAQGLAEHRDRQQDHRRPRQEDGTLDKLSKTYLAAAFGGDPEAGPGLVGAVTAVEAARPPGRRPGGPGTG